MFAIRSVLCYTITRRQTYVQASRRQNMVESKQKEYYNLGWMDSVQCYIVCIHDKQHET